MVVHLVNNFVSHISKYKILFLFPQVLHICFPYRVMFFLFFNTLFIYCMNNQMFRITEVIRISL